MKIGFFTDTYFPQVSGVATSIKTLKEELEKNGHEVYIFTTTDPNADKLEKDVIRMPSVPFVSFKDRRVVVRGMWYAYLVARIRIGTDPYTHRVWCWNTWENGRQEIKNTFDPYVPHDV